MQRREDWESRLYDRIEVWKSREFEWGKTDCTAFAGDIIEAMTGENPWSLWADLYDDERSAIQVIKKSGYDNLKHVLREIFGPEIPVAFARRGDLVFASDIDELTPQVGICLGELTVGWGTTSSLIEVKTLVLETAWHV